ncbi:MAG: aldehyde dehydrogenase family protein, partial [Giesbergeria sp.]|nr:aldehyde dehydrogenase family protein [Giesbergeria sp.]
SAKVTEHADELVTLEQRDCGKTTRQARAEVHALARTLELHAGACGRMESEALSSAQDGHSVLTWREPLGVTAHLIPSTHPMPIFGRNVGAALAAGNVCVVKPSANASLSLLRVAQLAAEAGLPAGALNIVTGYGHEAGDALARHPGIDHLRFAGSRSVGTLILQAVADRHCPVALELGGKNPHIVFADADLDAALPAIVHAILYNAGQSVAAASRLLVDALIYEPLLERLGRAFETLRVGPATMDLDLGPLIHPRQQQRVWDFLSDAQVAGIPMVAQGQIVDEAPEAGFYQAPTLLRDVPPAHRLAQEDIAGPVLCAMPFEDEDHAIELANTTHRYPAAGVWTRDAARALRMAKRIHSRQVFINHYDTGCSLGLPFGGFQPGAYGHETGLEAANGFSTLKTVALRPG